MHESLPYWDKLDVFKGVAPTGRYAKLTRKEFIDAIKSCIELNARRREIMTTPASAERAKQYLKLLEEDRLLNEQMELSSSIRRDHQLFQVAEAIGPIQWAESADS